jgi:uncharacterized protein (TIGR01777 family)
MELVLYITLVQGLLGAFDTLYHHEMTERLPWRPGAGRELRLHGLRNGLYVLVFFSFGWLEWHGAWAWVFAAILVVEIIITLMDFIEEDRARQLPASERVTHTILALNYGVLLALFAPEWWRWQTGETAFAPVQHGWLSWGMTLYASGLVVWTLRDLIRAAALTRNTAGTNAGPVPLLRQPGQRLLVVGGSGFIGAALVQALVAEGHQVTVISRAPAQAMRRLSTPVTLASCLDEVPDTAQFDAVINLAGETLNQRWSPAARARILHSRVDTTRAVVGLLRRLQNRPAVLLNASAIGIYGTHPERVFAETSRIDDDAIGAFPQEVCRAWEAAARAAEPLGVRVCCLRFGIVLEKEGGALAEMLFPFDFGLGGPVGSGRQGFAWIHRADAIGLIAHCLNTPALQGPINLVAPQCVPQRDFAAALGRAMRRPARLLLPAVAVRALFGDMGRVLLLHGQKVAPEQALHSGYAFRYPDIDSALAAIFA